MAIINIKELFKGAVSSGYEKNMVFEFLTPPLKREAGSTSFEPSKVLIPVDATLEENYTLSSSITEIPIQDGSVLSDHIHIQPERLSLKCIVSEAPVFFVASATQGLIDLGVSQTFDILTGTTGIRAFTQQLAPVLGGFEKYAQEFISGQISSAVLGDTDRKGIQKQFWENYLKKNFLQKKLFNVHTGLESVNNVFFESINFDREYKIGDSIIFECVLKELKIVSASETIIPAAEQAQKNVSRGEQRAKEFNLGITSRAAAEAGEMIVQDFPAIPFNSVWELEDRITSNVLEAGESVLNFAKSFF